VRCSCVNVLFLCAISVAQNLIREGKFKVKSVIYKVSPLKPRDTRAVQPWENKPTPHSRVINKNLQSATIEVSGISLNTTEYFVRMYFESEKVSGGGDISSMQFNREEGTATITFADPMGKQCV